MNAGLSNLATLKAWLLPSGMVDGADYDAQILAIGRGVATQIEQHCNRKLVRIVGDTFEVSADYPYVILPRLPIETITKLELRESMTAGWVDQGDVDALLQQLVNDSGLVEFNAALGLQSARLRLTYTGGYWFSQAEDTPAGAEVRMQDGTVELDADAESVAIEFPLEFAEIPRVTLTLQVPADGTIITVVPSAITATGFTALIGFPIPATGYVLSWEAKTSIANAAPETQPLGSTAVPDDLLLAWRTQCEWVWTKRDKLGLSIGEKQDNVFAGSLAKVVLLDGVKEQLRPFIRYAMT